jgi:GNAT superfamily N-acetyltransferase
MPLPSLFESIMAAAVLLRDPRMGDERGRNKVAYLALFQAANDSQGVERMLDYAREKLMREGYSRLLLPTGLSPHIGTGMQQDRWDLWPPLHTPMNPPYLPDLFDKKLQPAQKTRLFHAVVPPALPEPPSGPARIVPFDPQRLTADLLPLLVAATEQTGGLFPPPDAEEAEFLLRWLGMKTLSGRLAEVGGEPVGFVLLQPDDGERMRRAGGGRPLLWRAWLAATRGRPVVQGRLLFGGVLTRWRGRGIGQQLWQEARGLAHGRDWKSITIGPVEQGSMAAGFLGRQGAIPQQTFSLYSVSL